jgi:hypothetical protein
MKVIINMLQKPDFLNSSPNEVGNSWTSRVTICFLQTLSHAVLIGHYSLCSWHIDYLHAVTNA